MGIASSVHAQSLGAAALTITVDPAYPQPYSTITITPQSTLVDLSASVITISVNGKAIWKGSGTGGTAYQVGGSGETDTITVTAVSGGNTYEASITVHPSSVALVMEPLSSTHPFYEGGALIAPEGRMRFVALTDVRGSRGAINPSQLVYTWKTGNQILQDASGIGRSTLIALAPLLYRDTDLSVTVSTQSGVGMGQASLAISPTEPSVVLYHDGPLLGPNFDSALGSDYTMSGTEDAFRAVPYFFGSIPALAWSVNGVENGSDPVVTVRTTGTGAGTSALSVTANSVGSDTLSGASSEVNIHYGARAESTNIFGL